MRSHPSRKPRRSERADDDLTNQDSAGAELYMGGYRRVGGFCASLYRMMAAMIRSGDGSEMPRRKQSNDHMIDLIKAVPIFSACTPQELKQIAASGKEVEFEAGRVICDEGKTGVGLHIVTTGEVKVLVGGRTRRRLGPGAFFGEIALLDGGPRTASIVAATPVNTFAITTWNFRSVLKSHPSMPLKMLEEVCRRLRENERSLSN